MKRMTCWFLGLLMFAGSFHCRSQKEEIPKINRSMAVAGQFYPASAEELRETVKQHFKAAVSRQTQFPVRAVISPHAGYVFSGGVAASAFNQIDPDAEYEAVFLIGSSHQMAFEGASVYRQGDYVTPLGNVPVHRAIADSLIARYPVFNDRAEAHLGEHSLEVQLPFLQVHLKKPLRIVPIVIGASRAETCRRIAQALKPYLKDRYLFVISTDFSHYPSYADASALDRQCAMAIASNSADSLLTVMNQQEKRRVKNLATSLCGWSSVLTLLYMTENTTADYRLIQYKNSGDSPYGQKDRVVGYMAMAVTIKESKAMSSFILTEKDKKDLLTLARKTIESYVTKQIIPVPDISDYSEQLKTPCGAFVTLHKKKQLRGCIGRFGESEPLYQVVQQMAISAATQDYRFEPVSPDELKQIEIEISVLSPLKKIESIDEIELGRHGIWIKKGYRSGTFLPQVATETGWSKEEFLGYCSRDKAGIGWDGWKSADLYTYEANVFSESEMK